MKNIILYTVILILLAACSATSASEAQPNQPGANAAPMGTDAAVMPNPASAFCEEKGYKVEIRTAADGSQSGVCIFPDGSECDEWAFYRGECAPATQSGQAGDVASDGWQIYQNPEFGYTFHYPADAVVVQNDDPLQGISITGPVVDGESWPMISISHPRDRSEFQPPEDADLLQWLSDQALLGDQQMPNVRIAGETAVHLRHERSEQSYAYDRYYFAHDGQLFMILIGHTGDKEDWDLYNHFLASFQFGEPSGEMPPQTPIPTALLIDPAGYQGWISYLHPLYRFSLMIPPDWTVSELSEYSSIPPDHILVLRPNDALAKESIRLTFRETGEDMLLWPTGVGEGEFIQQGTLDIAGEPAERMLLVCPTGEITSIFYHGSQDQPNLLRGEMEFAFIFSASNTHCEPGYSLGGEAQWIGEMIIASLQLPE